MHVCLCIRVSFVVVVVVDTLNLVLFCFSLFCLLLFMQWIVCYLIIFSSPTFQHHSMQAHSHKWLRMNVFARVDENILPRIVETYQCTPCTVYCVRDISQIIKQFHIIFFERSACALFLAMHCHCCPLFNFRYGIHEEIS